MILWERIMRLLPGSRSRPDHSDRVDAAFARAAVAQEAKRRAAVSVTGALDAHLRLVEDRTQGVRRQAAEQARKWGNGRTSAMREQVDALVMRQERRNRDH